MPNSINGWTVLVPTSKLLAREVIPSTTRSITMRKACLPLFLALAHDYDDWIVPIDRGQFDDAGYCYRQSRTGAGWSNHASGSALDLNWSKEGAKKASNRKFWADPQTKADIDQIQKVYKVVTWGGDWSPKFWDPMHWEITTGVNIAQVEARIAFLGITTQGIRHKDAYGKRLTVPRG